MEEKSASQDLAPIEGEFVPEELDPTLKEEDEVGGDDEEKRVEYFCGFGRFRPKCLQVFRSAYFFTFLICCDIFVEGTLATGKKVLFIYLIGEV